MKKRIPSVSALYAAPEYFRKDDEAPERPDKNEEYPDTLKEPEGGRAMNDVYAGPEFFAGKNRKPSMGRVYAAPDAPEKKAVRPEADPMIMAVYAGPDYFSGKQGGSFGMQIPQENTPDTGAETEEPEAQEDEDELMRKLLEKYEKEPPVMMGLVQHDPSANPFLGMQPLSLDRGNHSFCCECGAKLPYGYKFCPECGALNEHNANRCPECGTKTVEGQKFCTECGHALK